GDLGLLQLLLGGEGLALADQRGGAHALDLGVVLDDPVEERLRLRRLAVTDEDAPLREAGDPRHLRGESALLGGELVLAREGPGALLQVREGGLRVVRASRLVG